MRLLKCILALSLFIGVKQWVEVTTKGFCLQKIFAHDLPPNPDWETLPLGSQDFKALKESLDQPFTLLGSGSECFAFLSADGKTVIKFFKLDHARPVYFLKGLLREDHSAYAGTLSNHWMLHTPLISPLETWRDRLLGIREFRITRTFSSLKMAFEELQEETGIVYLHLNPTEDIHQTITLIDANGYQHQVDLDTTRFLVQKCAIPLETHLNELIVTGDLPQAKLAIDSLFELILKRCRKGFADRDFINRNIGYIGNQAIEIDLGSFQRDPSMKNPWAYKKELFFATLELKEWLKSHSPELLTYYEESLNHLIRANYSE
jgi:hypothetical protein